MMIIICPQQRHYESEQALLFYVKHRYIHTVIAKV